MTNEELNALEEELYIESGEYEAQLLESIAAQYPYDAEVTQDNAWEWYRKMLMGFVAFKLESLRIRNNHEESIASKAQTVIREKAMRRLNRDENRYTAAAAKGLLNGSAAPLRNSFRLQAILDNANRYMQGFLNVTNTTAIETANKSFLQILNGTYLKTSSGVMTYQQAAAQAVQKLYGQGITAMHYTSESGRTSSISLEAGVRRCVVTTSSQVAGQMQLARAREWGCNTVEVSSHMGARPTHAEWQGRIYSIEGSTDDYPNLADSTEYGSVAGLKGANCNHDFYPFFPGLSKQRFFPYDKEENDKRYAEFQQQRGIEREIRQWKAREQGALAQGDAAGAAKAHSKVSEKQGKMRELLRNNGNERRYNREQIVRNSSQTGGGRSIIRPDGTHPGGGTGNLQTLNVTGGTARLSKEVVEQELSLIPKEHMKIAEKQISDVRIVAGGKGSYYDPATKSIVLSDAAQRGASIHEVAHAIERELRLYESKAFRRVWLADMQNIGLDSIVWDNTTFSEGVWRVVHPKFISEYQGVLYDKRWMVYDGTNISLEGMREYFSEGYREYLTDPMRLRDYDQALFDFIEGLSK